MLPSIEQRIASDIGARPGQVAAAVELIDNGATVPFIARYRKEVTGALDDGQLRALEERLGYLRDLEKRRAAILESLNEQGVDDPGLTARLREADTKARLEDLYLPYRTRRRTKAQIAREAGLEPLADQLLADPGRDPEATAQPFVSPDAGVADVAAALEGARQILIERFSEDADLLGELRGLFWKRGHIRSRLVRGREKSGAKFSDYFDHAEALARIPSHRTLALFRARNEGVVNLGLVLPGVEDGPDHPSVQAICRRFALIDQGRPADPWLLDCAHGAWTGRLSAHLTVDLFNQIRERAEKEAIRVFGENLKDILLAAPAGPRVTLGMDPGLRTGVKVAIIDGQGKLLDTATVYPHAPQKQWDAALESLDGLCRRHQVELIAIGNGTASRETDRLAATLIEGLVGSTVEKVMVSEAGASVYSASESAAREFPGLDVTLRGAVSIARRLQDPLAELVKIDPKAIGVGQYQHDVNQVKLAQTLDARVEDCVNAVGVDLNTASASLLSRVAGLNIAVADNIVHYRDQHGAFPSRAALMAVPRLGARTFEQAAGFLRIRDGQQPLDASGVHPEAYPVVRRILDQLGRPLEALMGDAAALGALDPGAFCDDRFGLHTVRDILAELEKPGRDPRPEFRTARFAEGVQQISDLASGMVLEGVVSNVTNFGAFVDVGVHQDGLVHISQLADRYVADPRHVVKAGDIVRVRVTDVDEKRSRIALTMRLQDDVATARPKSRSKPKPKPKPGRKEAAKPTAKPAGGAMADALGAALKKARKP